ncbi:MAG TPA: acyl-CoA thioesterase domain-containing protein [Acidimicrobiales bacterium]|nr:acyl-CoA thioesterase domain-containing protein [Acidimicrobiales bacterium]
MRFRDMMTLTDHGPDTFVGIGPRYPWGGLYGGQIVAQALRAAAATVDDAYRVHSLHAYFLRPGDHTAPVRYEVDRLRTGRSFVARAVNARQEATILHLQASFQLDRGVVAPRRADAPDVVGPDGLDDNSWTPMLERRMLPPGPGQVAAWMRVPELTGDDPVLSACALAYLSDDLPTDAVASAWRDDLDGDDWFGTSLDHAIWFQQPIPPDGPLLFSYHAEGLAPPRGLSVGRVFDAAGAHLATVTQEVLIRTRR